MPPSYRLQVITPQGKVYQDEIVHALIPGEDGFIGILAHHAPYVTSSPGGRLEVRQKNGQDKKFVVGSGFFEVAHNEATFLTQSFET